MPLMIKFEYVQYTRFGGVKIQKNAFATRGKTNRSSKIKMITTCFVKFSELVFKFCLQWKEHSHQYLVIYSDHLASSFQSDL